MSEIQSGWSYSIPPPSSFDRNKQAAFQKRIDAVAGATDGRSRIKLEWGPEALTWCPHRLENDPLGYIFPVFYAGRDGEGNYLAAERWVLLQRIEREQYGSTWEAIRYKKHDGSVWDLKGPCPSEKYVELHCHSYHDGKCCECVGELCKCEVHCWGQYVEPNGKLMDVVRELSWNSQHDPDVDPFADVRFFEARHAQQKLVSDHNTAWEKDKVETEKFDCEAVDLFLRQPRTVVGQTSKFRQVSGFRRTKSGLYVPPN